MEIETPTPAPASGSSGVTIRHVAAAAGVSIATVSRCFNGGERVLPETLERVHAVARSLGYTPSRTARGLVTGRTANIGVILPDVTNPFFAPILAAVESAAESQDRGVFIGDSREDADAELRIAQRMASQADGILLVSSRLPDDAVRTLASRIPVVLANRVVDGIDSAVIDVAPGLTAAVAHLAGLGHERIVYLRGPEGSWSDARKAEALTSAARATGLQLDVWGPHRPTFAAGRAVAERLVGEQVGAVVCYDDLVAFGVLTRCTELGVTVPTDLSIVGCDDALDHGMARPALTTVAGPSAQMGRDAAELLLARMTTPTRDPGSLVVRSRLVVRSSTGPARAPRSSGH